MTPNGVRSLTPKSTLESLRKEAKRWLKALRAGDARARARLEAALGEARPEPGLRDVQHALAREYGMAGWPQLKAALADIEAGRKTRAEAIEIVLRHAWDGDNGWRAELGPATRMLRAHPDIARDNIHIAAMCGELEEVRRRIAADPACASARGGPLNFEPLQYLAYGRLDLSAVRDNSVEIARLLIDHGADVNARFDDGWENPFTVLTGVIGEGEGVKPPHPRARDLAALLIERGADPYDTQAMYNTSIVSDDIYWMDMLFRESEARGEAEKWSALGKGKSLGGAERSTLDYLLGNAVSHSHLRRAQWLLDHGADPNGVNAYSERPHHGEAQLRGDLELTRMLEAAGARPAPVTSLSAFATAVMSGDRNAAARLAANEPGLPGHALVIAAGRGKTEPVRLLLDLGANVNAKDRGGATPLHWAAHGNAVEVAQLLIEHGAEIDVRDGQYGSTPLGWAVYLKQPDAAAFLAPLSRDAHALALGGFTERLRAVLAEEPALANAMTGKENSVTPLCCLPDDEDKAVEVVTILLAAGADPKLGRVEGRDAEADARKRGLIDAADLIAER